jgi:TolB protein
MLVGGAALFSRRGHGPDKLTAAPVPSEPKQAPAELLFVSWTHVCGDIYLTDIAGKEPLRLTHTGKEADYNNSETTDGSFQPCWSPDGKKIVFARKSGGYIDQFLFVMDADGKNVRQLTHESKEPKAESKKPSPPADMNPAWSPDGKKITFESQRENWSHIYAIDADGSNLKRLTPEDQHNSHPVWSPDGKKIAFRRSIGNGDVKENLFVMDADGSNIKALTQLPALFHVGEHSWSPDGKKLVFCSNRDEPKPLGDQTFVYVMDADGSNVKKLSKTATHPDHMRPAWSPDGKKIAYGEGPSTTEIVVINADGTGARQLTNLSGYNNQVLWSHDGKKLAFQHQAVDKKTQYAMEFSIGIVDADGENLKTICQKEKKLSDYPVEMAWRPLNGDKSVPIADEAKMAFWKAGAKGCSPRYAHSAVWDPKHEKIIVFGGSIRNGDSFD